MVYSAALLAYGPRERSTLRHRPILAFFLMAHTRYLVLCIGWGTYWHGMPNFSDTGFIK